MKRWLIIILIATGVIGIVGLTLMLRTFDGEVAVRVNIPKGATSESVQDSLTTSLGSNYGNLVYRLWQLAAGDPEKSHGSYLIEPGTSVMETVHRIGKGRQTPVTLTINNVRTFTDLKKKISSKLEISPEELDKAFTSVLSKNPQFANKATYTASVLPDTYEFYWTDSAEHVVEKLVGTRDNFWTKERLDKAAKLGLTPVEVATIASIVEEESNKKDERPMIARLYINRVKQGMKLQADPTVKFATGNFGLRRITGKHLRTDSPYNTYKNTGLPPGPIRVPQAATLDAVLNAPEHNYIYMCAKEDFSGRHNFASDYATHQKNAKKYQAALNRRGIR